jgi:hypothetical protein
MMKKVDYTRKVVREVIRDLHDDLEGSVDEVIQKLQGMKERYHAEGWSDLFIDSEYGWEDLRTVLYGKRPESDKEYDARIKDELRKVAARQKREERAKERAKEALLKEEEEQRKLYEELKAKFG